MRLPDERPDSPQYIAAFTADLINRHFYVLGYHANSGGRSLYRVPMDHPSGTANLFGYAAGDDMRYLAQGERLMAGNCGAADYAERAPGVGAGMTDHCVAGSIQRYPAAGSGTIVVVPPSAPSGAACPERPGAPPHTRPLPSVCLSVCLFLTLSLSVRVNVQLCSLSKASAEPTQSHRQTLTAIYFTILTTGSAGLTWAPRNCAR